MSELMQPGTYAAKATGEFEYGKSSTGKDQVGVVFAVTQGDHTGRQLTWYGFFNTTENAERAMKALRAAGWSDDDMAKLTGLGSTEVNIVVEIDEYEGVQRNKISWVNAGGVAMKNVMNEGEKRAFFERMKGLAIASRTGAAPAASQNGKKASRGLPKPQPAPAPSFPQGDDEIPF